MLIGVNHVWGFTICMKILTFVWVFLVIFSSPLFAEKVEGSVRLVDLISKTVTIAPKNPELAWANQVYLQTGNAKLRGIVSISELEIGDQIIAEGNKSDDENMDVRDLKLTSKSSNAGFENKKAGAAAPGKSEIDMFQEFYTDAPVRYNAGQKLTRGLLNIVSSPVEIVRSIQTTSNQESMTYGWTVGLFLGIGESAMRLGTGLFDTLTFPFNFPKADKSPIIEPEFVWEKPGVKYI